MSDLSRLRQQVYDDAKGMCEWPGCLSPGEQLAHFEHRGMGGNPTGSRNVIDNVALMCFAHHMMLDGEIRLKRFELRTAVKAAVNCRRENRRMNRRAAERGYDLEDE